MNSLNGVDGAKAAPFFVTSTKEQDFIIAIKSKEMFLAANSKESYEGAKAYLEFLLDLRRLEDAYAAAVEIAPFLPKLNIMLGVFASFLGDEELIKKHVTFTSIPPAASTEMWLVWIQLHSATSQLEELVVRGSIPPERDLQAMLYYFLSANHKVYSLLKDANPLGEIEYWLLWHACHKLGLKEEREQVLARIINDKIPIPAHYFRGDILNYLVETANESNHSIAGYLESQHAKNPYCLYLMCVFASLCPESKSAELKAKAKRAFAEFPTPMNRVQLILTGAGDRKIKFDCLLKLFKSTSSPDKRLFSMLYAFYNDQPQIQKDLVANAQSRSTSSFFELVATSLKKIDNTTTEADVESNLSIIDNYLKKYPHNRMLLRKKIHYLYYLNRFEEAGKIVRFYLHYFGCSTEMIELIYSRDILIQGDMLEKLRQGYEIHRNDKAREVYKKALFKSRPAVEYISFIISTLHLSSKKVDDFNDIEEALLSMPDQEKGYALIDSIPRTLDNIEFIQRRAMYYTESSLWEKAMEDLDFVCRFRPSAEPYCEKLLCLIELEKGREAAEALFASKYEIDEQLLERIISILFFQFEHELVAKIYKKFKTSLNYQAKCYAADSIKHTKDYPLALSIYKELKAKNPKDEQNYFDRAKCFEQMGQIGSAMDELEEGLKLVSDSVNLAEFRIELIRKRDSKEAPNPAPAPEKAPKWKSPDLDSNKIPYLIEDPKKKDSKRENNGPRPETGKRSLQKSNPHAVDPLIDTRLKAIKEIARKGETQTGPKPKEAPAPVPAAAPRMEAPRPIVKSQLKPQERIFLIKAWEALDEYSTMPSLEQDIIYRNQIYTLLRAFTPLRLLCTHQTVKEDLIRIRNQVRHETDVICFDRLATLFKYLESINLKNQLKEWIQGKGLITRIVLSNQIITIAKPKKTAPEKVIAELEFIQKARGEEGSWKNRLHHRNAIKASLSIIGEASNFLSDELKAELATYRDVGNTIAHQFYINGETIENLERFKEEDISSENLWVLTQNAETLLKKIKACQS